MEEIWKDIPGYEGLYQASNLGRVRSLDREVFGKYDNIAVKKGKILTPRHRRAQVTLMKDGIRSYPLVSRLVYSAFYGPIPDGMQVNHIDENPEKNNLENLNLMTPKENTNYGTGIERRAKTCSKALKGKMTYETNPNAKPVYQYSVDGKFLNEYPCLKTAAESVNRDWTAIWQNIKHKTKTCAGYVWSYEKKEAV